LTLSHEQAVEYAGSWHFGRPMWISERKIVDQPSGCTWLVVESRPGCAALRHSG
jgi:hypothetical protein